MWTYVFRRLLLMIPTLWGVTIVSFLIMQLAPGDPLLLKAGRTGVSGQTSQTREAYLIQKRDLCLDKPLVLNFNYFRDYTAAVRVAAHYLAMSEEDIAKELSQMAEGEDGELAGRRRFLEQLRVPQFAQRLEGLEALKEKEKAEENEGDKEKDREEQKQQQAALAQAVQAYVQVFCEDTGLYGAPAAAAILQSPEADLREKIGAIRALYGMVPEPFVYTYSRHQAESETPAILATWRTWWERFEGKFPPLLPERLAVVSERFTALVAEPARGKLLEGIRDFAPGDARFFAEKLLGDSTLQEKVVAALGLRQLAGTPLVTDVPREARGKLVHTVAENWLAWYAARQEQLRPGPAVKLWAIVADTQYAHMLVRLATFQFGRSAVKTREPVLEKIWRAMLVTAPIMILSEALIYLLAVPLGIFCAVRRGGWGDRAVSLGLFLLYSVPPFVAGILFLVFFCYGDYLRWFPELGLHCEGAQHLGWAAWLLDYCRHLVLPVVCLSLFSLAGMAMYARGSMLDVLGQDYIRTARAKGLPERTVIFKHAFRNALIPIVTLFASFLPAMLGGSVLIEYLFGIPGMGMLSWESILLKDIPTVMAMVYVEAILVMLSILLSDLLYVLVDPRISFGAEGQAT
ncbi:MAG: ABC transporter permease subunit [Thermoguttaceae bacterium]